MIPFFICYSMFGFQRIGDLAWAAGDMRSRGFLIGGTSGRTTLNGEGLQHQDGHSQLLAAAYPFVRAYDPAFAYEVAALVRAGITAMFGEEEADEVWYLTLANENRPQPPRPAWVTDDDIVGGISCTESPEGRADATLLFSGSLCDEAARAAAILRQDHGLVVDLFSVTSYQQLRAEAIAAEAAGRSPRISELLGRGEAPVVAVSDFVSLVPEQVARYVQRPFLVLGTDGAGLSDDRPALRAHFGVDAEAIVAKVLAHLPSQGPRAA
jgi:pyruvate dehydrogenase E1 component